MAGSAPLPAVALQFADVITCTYDTHTHTHTRKTYIHTQVADADDKWDVLLEEHREWTNRPIQPPGLSRSGQGMEAMHP
jgi:hypothetical protein